MRVFVERRQRNKTIVSIGMKKGGRLVIRIGGCGRVPVGGLPPLELDLQLVEGRGLLRVVAARAAPLVLQLLEVVIRKDGRPRRLMTGNGVSGRGDCVCEAVGCRPDERKGEAEGYGPGVEGRRDFVEGGRLEVGGPRGQRVVVRPQPGVVGPHLARLHPPGLFAHFLCHFFSSLFNLISGFFNGKVF